MDISNCLVDFAREDMDIGIRGGSGHWPGLIKQHIMPWRFRPLGSPALVEQTQLRSPADLLNAPLLSPDDPWWTNWFGAAGITASKLDIRPELRIGLQPLDGAAALNGQGFGLLMPELWTTDIMARRLVAPFDITGEADGGTWLVYPERKKRSPKIWAFRDGMLGELAASQG